MERSRQFYCFKTISSGLRRRTTLSSCPPFDSLRFICRVCLCPPFGSQNCYRFCGHPMFLFQSPSLSLCPLVHPLVTYFTGIFRCTDASYARWLGTESTTLQTTSLIGGGEQKVMLPSLLFSVYPWMRRHRGRR